MASKLSQNIFNICSENAPLREGISTGNTPSCGNPLFEKCALQITGSNETGNHKTTSKHWHTMKCTARANSQWTHPTPSITRFDYSTQMLLHNSPNEHILLDYILKYRVSTPLVCKSMRANTNCKIILPLLQCGKPSLRKTNTLRQFRIGNRSSNPQIIKPHSLLCLIGRPDKLDRKSVV